MKIVLTPAEIDAIAGLFAGFLERRHTPGLKECHPTAIKAALLENLEALDACWQARCWPEKSILAGIAESTARSLFADMTAAALRKLQPK